jgi:ABC-type transport system substrate-binding protein
VQSVIGEIVKQNLADVGIEATIVRKDLASAENDIAGLNYQLSTTFWSDYLPEPTVQPQFAIDPAYCCKAYFTEYDNPAHVKVVKDAIAETDPAARKEAFDGVQRAIAEAANVLPLFFPKLTFVGTAEVAGSTPTRTTCTPSKSSASSRARVAAHEEPLLEVRGVTKVFGGRRRFGGGSPEVVAVRDASLEVRPRRLPRPGG